MSKRHKRRIQELCGFTSLSREEKLIRANEILNSSDLKQSICNQILGCTFKDIERSMVSIINERQLTEYQKEQLELEQMAPEKFDHEFEFRMNKHVSDESAKSNKEFKYRPLSKEQTQALIQASNKPKISDDSEIPSKNYEPMPRELAEQLVRDYLQSKEKQKQEREQWDSPKTIELEEKTTRTKKRTKSTKV